MAALSKVRLMVGDAVTEQDSLRAMKIKNLDIIKARWPCLTVSSKVTTIFKMSIKVKVAPRGKELWK